MRIMGLDYGSKTVGVAVSDELLYTAQGVEIIRRESENRIRKTLQRLDELIEQYDVQRIVLGLPKKMNNTIGDRAEKTLEFKETLEKRCNVPVVLWDERLTTVEANKSMNMTGVKRSDRGKYVDCIAAMLILQGYLDFERNRQNV